MKQKRLLAILGILGLTVLFWGKPAPVRAQAGTPYEMIAEINNLRAANGLPSLVVNDYLMLSAQNHADWIAETGQGGHVGINGTKAIDRARAVGYGEGAQIWVTENWARGPGLTVSDCIYVMWDDEAHMGNMLTTWHNEFGVGVALDAQGFTVYVVNFGHTSGSAPAEPTEETPLPGATGTPGASETPGTAPTPAPYIQPVTTATPNADGSVVHVVQYGQTLWAIAEAYGISLADLLAQNGLTEDSAIYPDQELLVVPAGEDAPGATEEPAAESAADPMTAPEKEDTSPAFQEEENTAPTQKPENPPPANAEPSPKTVTDSQPEEPSPTTSQASPRQNALANIFSGDTLVVGVGLVVVSVFGLGLLLFTAARLK
jgi:uncharacterized protein YkwD